MTQKRYHRLFLSLCILIIVVFVLLIAADSPYLDWDYSKHAIAAAGIIFHAFEWLFARLAPILLIVAIIGTFMTKKKNHLPNQ